MLQEYLELFSNHGDIKVTVKFKNTKAFIAPQSMFAEEVQKLITNDGFQTQLRFDDHPFDIQKYEINPNTKTLVITAIPLKI